jgi:hypothetical protein
MSETKELIERLKHETKLMRGMGMAGIDNSRVNLMLEAASLLASQAEEIERLKRGLPQNEDCERCGGCGELDASSAPCPACHGRGYHTIWDRLQQAVDAVEAHAAQLRVFAQALSESEATESRLREKISRLTRERDEALEALKEFMSTYSADEGLGPDVPQDCWKMARSVLQSSSDSPPKASMREPGENIVELLAATAELLAATESGDDEAFDRLLDVMRERKSSSDSGQGDE